MVYDFKKLTFEETQALNCLDTTRAAVPCIPSLDPLRTESEQMVLVRDQIMARAIVDIDTAEFLRGKQERQEQGGRHA